MEIPTLDLKTLLSNATNASSRLSLMKCSMAFFVFLSVVLSFGRTSCIACIASSGLILRYRLSISNVKRCTFSFPSVLFSFMLCSFWMRFPVWRMNCCCEVRTRRFFHSVQGSKLDSVDKAARRDFLCFYFFFSKLVYAYGHSGWYQEHASDGSSLLNQ